MIPTLSLIPPSCNTNQLKFQKCMLLLFKPFSTFQELYDGISWDETYSEFLETEENKRYVENMDDFLNNMDEAFEDDEIDDQLRDEVIDDECEDDTSQSDEIDDTGLDSLTTEALDVIRNTPWLSESVSNHQTYGRMQPLFGDASISFQVRNS